jgi:hypothetical protein
MRYIKTYEEINFELKNKFIELKNVPYKSFAFGKRLRSECLLYDIEFKDLIEEMLIDKTIAFICYSCTDENYFNQCISYRTHDVIGKCIRAISIDESDEVRVKIEGLENWHTLPNNRKVRIYNYVEGTLMEEIQSKKDAEKYNL